MREREKKELGRMLSCYSATFFVQNDSLHIYTSTMKHGTKQPHSHETISSMEIIKNIFNDQNGIKLETICYIYIHFSIKRKFIYT